MEEEITKKLESNVGMNRESAYVDATARQVTRISRIRGKKTRTRSGGLQTAVLWVGGL
jgi:hypothetical protein